MISAICTSHPQIKLLSYPLQQLTLLENRPDWLTEMAYEWCSVICENYSSLGDGKFLLFLALEVGFRHLNPKLLLISANLTHTNHHQKLIDIVFGATEDSNGTVDSPRVADFLHAWISSSHGHRPHMSLKKCAGHLIDFTQECLTPTEGWGTAWVPHSLRHFKPSHSTYHSTQRLRQLVINTIGFIGFQEFKQVGVEGFCKLLDHLDVSIKDIHRRKAWTMLLLDTVQSAEGIQYLSHPYWELLVELSISQSEFLKDTWSPHIVTFLEGHQEWDKLECWIGVYWIFFSSLRFNSTHQIQVAHLLQVEQWSKEHQKDLEHMTLSLFHQRPGAIQKLKKWMEQWNEEHREDIPGSFQQICEQAHSMVAQQGVL